LLAQLRSDELDIVDRSLEILASAVDRTIANAKSQESHS
jgi:hypothetical protein